MKNSSIINTFFLLFSFVGFQHLALAENKIENKTLVILGDSLTEGLGVARESAFPFLLEKKLLSNGKHWSVINSGISGSTTASAPSRVKWILRNNPDAVLIILGANDGLRGLPVKETEKHLQEAINIVTKQKIKIFLGGLYMPPNYGKQYSLDFKNMYLHLAKTNNLKLIPFILDKVAGDSKYNQADGIHPNEKGHEIIANTIYEQLKDLL
jgi:acyl-CoA thioesterase-1